MKYNTDSLKLIINDNNVNKNDNLNDDQFDNSEIISNKTEN